LGGGGDQLTINAQKKNTAGADRKKEKKGGNISDCYRAPPQNPYKREEKKSFSPPSRPRKEKRGETGPGNFPLLVPTVVNVIGEGGKKEGEESENFSFSRVGRTSASLK